MPLENNNLTVPRAGRREWIGLAVISIAAGIGAVIALVIAMLVAIKLRHLPAHVESEPEGAVTPPEAATGKALEPVLADC